MKKFTVNGLCAAIIAAIADSGIGIPAAAAKAHW